MRDWMIFCVMIIFIHLSIRNVVAAYLLWSWTSLAALVTFVYGFMASVPIVQLFAIITLLHLLRGKNDNLRQFTHNKTTILYIIYSIHAIASATVAYDVVTNNWFICNTFLKSLLFCILMPMFFTTRLRIHSFVVLSALAISFYASVEGLKFLNSGGSHHIQGIANFGDNNHTALVFVMGLPLMWYLFQYSSNKLARIGFASAIFLTVLAVIATGSRGGLVCMCGISIWIVMKSRRKIVGAIFVILAGVAVVQLAPPSWFNRMDTISTASESDTSFRGRLAAWKRSSAIALENPVFGGGFHAVQAASIFEKFRYQQGLLGSVDAPVPNYPAAAHSIYFEVMGDTGFVGLSIFLACLFNTFITRIQIKSLSRLQKNRFMWASDLSDSIAGCLVAYMIGGAAVSMAYFEMTYTLMMLMAVLKIHIEHELKKQMI